MTEISATIRLRPTRIGFLVRPTDMKSVKLMMRICTCLWGGVFNPIIPVFRSPPKDWKPESFESAKGLEVARGYIRFFEPDVFVESEDGLLEEAGLGKLRREGILSEQVISLASFLRSQDHRDWAEPSFGLSILDVLRSLYESEQRFQLKDPRPAVLVRPDGRNGLVEAIFGAYPQQTDADYFTENYKHVFAPQERDPGPEIWRAVFSRGAQTPLRVTRHAINTQRQWDDDLTIFVFDPAKATDLIDLWNLRLESRPVLPVPIEWVDDLSEDLQKVIKSEFRSVRGNPYGVMHSATVEFGRSISKERAYGLSSVLGAEVPQDALVVKHWRNRIWVQPQEHRLSRERRLNVVAEERRESLTLKEGERFTSSFEAIAPEFASRFGGHAHRWVNSVQLSVYGHQRIATVFPFNTFDRSWPRLEIAGEPVKVGSEGWCFSQRYPNWSERILFPAKEDAIIGWFKQIGIEAKLSDPGSIAKQMLDHLGGIWGVSLLADIETLKLLNKMAGGVRRKKNESETYEETFERRSAPIKTWQKLLARRQEKGSIHRIDLAEFTKRSVIRLGLETGCPHCQGTNWSSLTAVDYTITCDRCLNRYEFPQAHLQEHNRNWHYRVVGPFSVPDYGRGSYSALLSLRAIQIAGVSREASTFSTAMDLSFDGAKVEADFVAWQSEERLGTYSPPEIIIGEAKSLGEGDLIKSKDLEKLRIICRKIPGAIVVISVLRDRFTASERKILVPFVKWCRRPDERGRPENPVILLTAHELLAEHHIGFTWKQLGAPYSEIVKNDPILTLQRLAEATQQIYLGLPSYHEQRVDEWKKRRARKQR